MAGLIDETNAQSGIIGRGDSKNRPSSPEDAESSSSCPQCKSKRVWRDGSRFQFGEKIQRWICRDCGLRFSDPNDLQMAKKAIETISTIETQLLKTRCDIVNARQICVTETKNLVAEPQTIEVLRRNETDVKGKIIEYAWWLKKDGKSEATIIGRSKLL